MSVRVSFGLALVFVVMGLSATGAHGDLLDKLQQAGKDTAKTLSNACLINDQCYKDFLTLNNYCCLKTVPQCCNVFDYIFSASDPWERFLETMKNPRPINIIILVVVLLIAGILLSMLLSLVGYFFCGCSRICCCCGERKYTIVSH